MVVFGKNLSCLHRGVAIGVVDSIGVVAILCCCRYQCHILTVCSFYYYTLLSMYTSTTSYITLRTYYTLLLL